MKLGGMYMKKYISGLITGIIICFMVTGLATSTIRQAYFTDVRLQLNGEDISSDYPPVAVETDETKIYGSIRSIAEAMGGTVEWSPGVINIKKIYNMDKIDEKLSSVGIMHIYKKGKEVAQASGVYYKRRFLTVKHATKLGDSYKILLGGMLQTYDAKEVETYGDIDFATINLPHDEYAENRPITLGDSDTVKEWDRVYTASSPKGIFNCVGVGVVNRIYFDKSLGQTIDVTLSETTVAGSSGGGLFNDKGELIGIIIGGRTEDQMHSAAIPINRIKEFIE
jgi:S1-C subfamily serine protease